MVELALAVVVQNQVFWMQGRLTGDKGISNFLVGSKLTRDYVVVMILYICMVGCVCVGK